MEAKSGLVRRMIIRVVEPSESLRSAADTLAFHLVGALPVLDDGVLVGIVSERDVVRAVAEEADIDKTPVSDYMTPGPVAVAPNASLAVAAALMSEWGTRHVPVVERGKVVGMISSRDVIDELVGMVIPRDTVG